MKHIWKFVLIVVLALIVLGTACAVIGLFTGASVERMIEVFFGSRETFELVIQLLEQELASIRYECFLIISGDCLWGVSCFLQKCRKTENFSAFLQMICFCYFMLCGLK